MKTVICDICGKRVTRRLSNCGKERANECTHKKKKRNGS